ncbi:MAG TPA: aldo/keto reductase [Anaerolineaceae bacterium]|nr:aldo/keto reductase [Anaerolineaceae bacterium]
MNLPYWAVKEMMMQNGKTSLKTRQFGSTDMQITSIGFGAWALGGGDWVYAWGPQDDKESTAAIHHALDLGINWIDTAAGYGLGHSEEVVGQTLAGMSERPFVFTKCSMVWNEKGEFTSSLSRASVRRECENSLRRLKMDYVDLYQIHWPNPDPDIEEGWATLAELQKEGKVRWIGVSNFSVEQMKRVQAIAPINSLQPPYSLVRPEVEKEILPFCEENNIGVIVYSPMYSGLLTGKMTPERIKNMPPDDWRQHDPEFQMPKLEKNLKIVDALAEIGKKHGVEPGVVAIAWTLRLPAVTAAIVGMRRPSQVDGVFPAQQFRLTADEIKLLNEVAGID